MAFTTRHWYYTPQFTTYNGTEIAQFGLRIVPTDPATQPSQTNVDNLNAEVLKWWNGTTPYSSSGFCRFWSFAGSKLQWTDTNGLAVPGSIVQIHTNTPAVAGPEAGANDTHYAPGMQHSARLKSSIPRGHGSAGRVFLPPSCALLQPTGNITAGFVAIIANNLAILLSQINLQAAVGSVSVMSKVGAGVTSAVVATDIGLRLDFQRRRAGHIAESPRQTAVVTP